MQENGDSDRACWFDTSMTSTVAGFLSLKSSMFSNITHNLNIAVRPAFEALRYSLYNPFHKPYEPSLRVRGVWTKRGQEHRSTQFQLFRIPFKDLQKTVSESVLPLIYRSYVRLQEYCPVRRHNTREAKVFLYNIILIFKYYIQYKILITILFLNNAIIVFSAIATFIAKTKRIRKGMEGKKL